MDVQNIGLIGLGNAGRPICERLIAKGYRITVFDRDLDAIETCVSKGAQAAGSPAACAAELVLTVLPGTVEVRQAVLGPKGVLEGLLPGQVLLDLSGTDPLFARELQAATEARGGRFLGATLHADGAPAITIPQGLISIVVGGDRATFDACVEPLKALALKIVHVANPATPKAIKIAVIMLAVANSTMSTEVAAWLWGQGIDPRHFLSVLEETGSNGALRFRQFMRRYNSDGGTLSNIRKDLRQALDLAQVLTVPMPFATMANQYVEMAEAQGHDRITPAAAFTNLYQTLTGMDLTAAAVESGHSPPKTASVTEIHHLDEQTS